MKSYPFTPLATKSTFTLPYFEVGLRAGFPSAADDYLPKALDLHELLVEHPAATFFVRVEGDSMQNAGIFSGDILIVDRSLKAKSESIVVALIDGEFTVKRLRMDKETISLIAEHPNYPPIPITEEQEFQVWGVVTYVIHKSR